MIIADAMGIVMLFKKAAERITGLAKEAVLNKPVTVDIAEGRACT